MAHSKYIVCIILAICLCSCEKQEHNIERIVVEGYIAAGCEPIVHLHYSIPLYDAERDISFEEMVANSLIPFGKVVLSNGEDSVILSGGINTDYMPPYVYTTTRMLGEAGKNYSIHVTHKENEAWAYTTIPADCKATIDSITMENVNDSLVGIYAYITVPENEERYYTLQIRSNIQPILSACPFGTFCTSSATESNQIRIKVYRSDYGTLIPNFSIQDNLDYELHVAEITRESYEIWDAINAQAITQGMFFLSIYKNLPSNISTGLGYWCGYNTTSARFHTNTL